MTIYETDTDRYKTYSGTAWEDGFKSGAWISYTPTISNWTLGNGTMVAKYQKVGRLITVTIEVVWGSTSTFASNAVFSLPVNAVSQSVTTRVIGFCQSRDVSAGLSFFGSVRQSTNNQSLIPDVLDTSVAFAAPDSLISTRPFTWGVSDELSITAIYEAAS
jgi:hypothetical protein